MQVQKCLAATYEYPCTVGGVTEGVETKKVVSDQNLFNILWSISFTLLVFAMGTLLGRSTANRTSVSTGSSATAKEQKVTSTEEFKISMVDKRDKKNLALWKEWAPAAMRATEIWQKEVKVPSFTLVADKRDVCRSEIAIACSVLGGDNPTVWIVGDPGECSKTSVMVHEIGHLLGVPDIKDDSLMNAECMGSEKLSEAAIAIAKDKALNRKQF